jgi:WD40 repeat protein
MASCKVDASNDFIPTWLEVGQHKVSSRLIVCLAVQQTRMNKQEQYDNYLLVLEFDQNNRYQSQEIARQKSRVPQITRILYRPKCGLILACFMGYVELFDSIEFQSKSSWDNEFHVGKEPRRRDKAKKSGATIDCLDYSEALDLIAFGGIQGKIGVLDSNTLIFKGLYEAHHCEVAAVYFYDKEKQLISLALDGVLSLWDAQKMQVLQTVNNRQNMHGVNQINASFFCRQSATMLLATSRVLVWSLKEDTTKKVEIEQQEAVAKDFLTQFRKGLTRQGVLLNVDPP